MLSLVYLVLVAALVPLIAAVVVKMIRHTGRAQRNTASTRRTYSRFSRRQFVLSLTTSLVVGVILSLSRQLLFNRSVHTGEATKDVVLIVFLFLVIWFIVIPFLYGTDRDV